MAEKGNSKPPVAPPPLTGVSSSQDADLLEPGESIVTIVRRSIIGLVGIYILVTIAIVAIFVLVISVSPGTFNTSSTSISTMLSAIMILGAVLLVLILFTATYIYRQNRLLITNRSLVQISQKSLFINKASRLSFSNVEDVSAEQRGILASIFGYGTLAIQTAGERENFSFPLCPSPNRLADRIIEARQKYAESIQDEI
jgi:hypothetical protein